MKEYTRGGKREYEDKRENKVKLDKNMERRSWL